MPKKQYRYRIVTFKIDPRMLAIIDKQAARLGKSRSDIIRDALNFYITYIYRQRGS